MVVVARQATVVGPARPVARRAVRLVVGGESVSIGLVASSARLFGRAEFVAVRAVYERPMGADR